MREALFVALAALLGFLPSYGFVAFVAWDWNPADWPAFWRFFGGLAVLICTVGLGAAGASVVPAMRGEADD